MSSAVILLRGAIRTETRLRNEIENNYDKSPIVAGMQAQCDEYARRYPSANHRRGCASAHFNCHGLTFANRRTGITSPDVIRTILKEDDYRRVMRGDVLPGDTVLYVDNLGDVHHSGIVVEVLQLGPKVLSKWGDCHEVVHMVGDCPYQSSSVEYWRVAK